jgi:23S rRNA pseudouridine1911/1915/1917 synthase
MSNVSLVVSEVDAGVRVDKFLSTVLPELTRQRVQALMKDGRVQKNGVVTDQCSAKVKVGEHYTVTIPPPTSLALAAEDIPLTIIYEDEHLLVIDKPVGMVVHPAAGVASGTLVNALLHHFGESLSSIGGVSRPGIVHRLDKDTSGLMLVARTDIAHQGLSAQLQNRSLSRTYHAIVWGMMRPAHGTVDAPIARSPIHRQKMAIVAGGRHAVTHYRTLTQYLTQPSSHTPAIPFASKVECKLETGRTHQIRVHLSEQGCGIIGDTTYGAATNRRMAGLSDRLAEATSDALRGCARQALHAVEIAFVHPVTHTQMQFSSPYPADMAELVATLEESSV